jgi:hypothetical protein
VQSSLKCPQRIGSKTLLQRPKFSDAKEINIIKEHYTYI